MTLCILYKAMRLSQRFLDKKTRRDHVSYSRILNICLFRKSTSDCTPFVKCHMFVNVRWGWGVVDKFLGATSNALQNQGLLETQGPRCRCRSLEPGHAQTRVPPAPATPSEQPWGHGVTPETPTWPPGQELTLSIFWNKYFYRPVCFHLSLGNSHFLLF